MSDISDHDISVSISVTKDGDIRLSTPTGNYGASTSEMRIGAGFSKGGTPGRTIASFPLVGSNGRAVSAALKAYVSSATGSGSFRCARLTIADPDYTQGTGNGTATGDGVTALVTNGIRTWNVVWANTDGAGAGPGFGTDVDAAGAVSFSSPSAGLQTLCDIADLLTSALRAIVDGGSGLADAAKTLIVMLYSYNEGDTGYNMGVRPIGNGGGSPVISVDAVIRPEPYDRFMEAREILCDIGPVDGSDPSGEQAFSVIVTAGEFSFDVADEVTIEVANEPTFASPITPSSVGVESLSGVSEGDRVRIDCEFDPSEVYGPWYYRAVFSVGGVDYYGAAHEFHLIDPDATEGRDILITDSHDKVIRDALAGKTGTLLAYPHETAAAQAHVNDLVVSRIASVGRENYRIISYGGDCREYVKMVGEAACFPTLHDGSGVAAASPTHQYAKDIDDCRDVSRAFFNGNSAVPTDSMPSEDELGNHDGAHWHDYTANNGAISELGDNSLAVHKEHGGIPAGTLTLSMATTWRGRIGHADGLWHARLDGNVLRLKMNPYCDSETSGTVTDPLPLVLADPEDWKLGSTQWDAFKAIILAYKDSVDWILIDMHNLPGGVDAVSSPVAYGRSDSNWIACLWWGRFAHWWLSQNVPGKTVVFLKHDHCKNHVYKDGILYYWQATPGNVADQGISYQNVLGGGSGPYNRGFRTYNQGWLNATQYNAKPLHRESTALGNLGFHERHWTADSLKLRYIVGMIVTSPADFTGPTYDARRDFGLADDAQIVEEITYPSDFSDTVPTSIADAFAGELDTEDVEDSVAPQAAGTEQDPMIVSEPRQHNYTPDELIWKNYSSETHDDETFLAVRNSPIDSEVHLCSKRPFTAAADYVTQGIRRALASIHRTVAVKTRVEGNPSALIGMIQVCGADADPNFASTAVGLGLFVTYDDVRAVIKFDDGSTVASLSGTLTLSPSIEDTMTEFEIVHDHGRVTLTVADAMLASITLSGDQQAWLAEADHNWLGLAARTNNVTSEGHVVEFKDFEAGAFVGGGGRPSDSRPAGRRPADFRPVSAR